MTPRNAHRTALLATGAAMLLACGPLRAQEAADPAAELAKKLANPVAALISVPLQYNYDANYGEDDEGARSVLNVQPVIPFSLNTDWNLITRTIIPLVDQHDLVPDTEECGLGDILQSFFLSPKQPLGGWVLGAGPVLLYPTATAEMLGGEKWGAGPTALALRQDGPWTYGLLANHVWSYAGDADRADVNSTFLQPFVSYITKTKTTFGLNAESTYDWEGSEWSVPVSLSAAQLLKVGGQMIQVGAGVRYWADAPESGAEGFGFRFTLTFLFPK